MIQIKRKNKAEVMSPKAKLQKGQNALDKKKLCVSNGNCASIPSVDISSIKSFFKNFVILDSSMTQPFLTAILSKNHEALTNEIYWHKFCVTNTKDMTRNDVLKLLVDHLCPIHFAPVYYIRESVNTSCFMARNCEVAIKKLCENNLQVESTFNKGQPLKLQIILRFHSVNELKVDASTNINKVLAKRGSKETSTINLNNFAQDPDLSEYCPLSQPKLMSYILHLLNLKRGSYKHVILSNNGIRILTPIERLISQKSYITSLDLRNNLIPSLAELEPLSQFDLTELHLEGNPLCDKYESTEYIQRIKQFCPKIQQIDGIDLLKDNLPKFVKNFLCDDRGQDVVDLFIEHYFSVFDSKKRKLLQEVYHETAIFSLSCYFISGQLSSASAHLSTYKSHARNLIKGSRNNSATNLKIGNETIADFFTNLPATQHDPYSFTVDVTRCTETNLTIVVTGVFRELNDDNSSSNRLLGFNRCFILECSNDNYYITNEQLHLFNALTPMEQAAFKHPVPLNPQVLQPAKCDKERMVLVNAMKIITNLKAEWSVKFLEDCEYELKNALQLFMDLYKLDRIPKDSFQS